MSDNDCGEENNSNSDTLDAPVPRNFSSDDIKLLSKKFSWDISTLMFTNIIITDVSEITVTMEDKLFSFLEVFIIKIEAPTRDMTNGINRNLCRPISKSNMEISTSKL